MNFSKKDEKSYRSRVRGNSENVKNKKILYKIINIKQKNNRPRVTV